MNSSQNGRITDELLSAYIDNAVTEKERSLVEAAVAADEEVAWRLDTLEQTVQMLRSLPELALPRSFALQESKLLSAGPADAAAVSQQENVSWLARLSSGWGSYWRSGTLAYRNLAATSLVLLLVLVGGRTIFAPTMNSLARVSTPAGEAAFSEAPAPAAGGAAAQVEDAPQEESMVAEAPTALPKPAASSDGQANAAALDEAAVGEERESAQAESMPANAGEALPVAPAPMALAIEESDEASMATDAGAAAAPEAEAAVAVEASSVVSASPMVSASAARMAPLPSASAAVLEDEDQPGVAGAAEGASGYSGPSAMSMAEDGGAPLAEAAPLSKALSAEALAVEEPSPPADSELLSPAKDAEAVEAAPAPDASSEESVPSSEREPVLAGSSGDSTAAIAAVPTAQPMPTATRGSSSGQASDPASPMTMRSIDLFRLLAAGLLISSILFGGLWWRSRATN